MHTDPAGQPVPADGFETLAIHAGQEPDPLTGAVVPPIYQVSTYKQDGVGGLRGGYEYSRTANPTRRALEECLRALEGGASALAFASGMAATDCVLRTVCRPGDRVLIPHDAYGGTFRLFDKVLAAWGVTYQPVVMSDLAAVREALAAPAPSGSSAPAPSGSSAPAPSGSALSGSAPSGSAPVRLLWIETPTNPLLSVADIVGLAAVAHDAGALLAVDNTFASPYLQQPLALGADIVVHSSTKYLGGHSDILGGAAVTADPALGEQLAFLQNATGAVAGPFDAWLTLRGIRTLAVRMDRHSASAQRVAEMLSGHPAVSRVYYPGLPAHPGHEIAAKQMRGFGGMVSFAAGGPDEAVAICGRTRLFTLAESLGGVESLIEHPARMTHSSVAGSALEVPADLIRLSVGLESCDDLLEDLRAALSPR
jgi:cystathionine gamma-synthase